MAERKRAKEWLAAVRELVRPEKKAEYDAMTANAPGGEERSGKRDQPKPPSLAVSDLSEADVRLMFKLNRIDSYKVVWPPSPPIVYECPPQLGWVMERIAKVVGDSAATEAVARSKIDIVLFVAISEEKARFDAASVGPGSPAGSISSASSDGPKPIFLAQEATLTHIVRYKGQPRTLQGRADYAFYYGTREEEDEVSNLAIAEAKKQGRIGEALAQLLAYMAIAHMKRREKRKNDTTVYGIASDSKKYSFHKIDHNGTESESRTYSWPDDAREIVSYIRFIFRESVHRSPTTSIRTRPSIAEVMNLD